MVCTFAGHRPERLPWGSDETDPRCLELKARLAQQVRSVYDLGCRRFLCGMARGCDWYFCEAVIALRRQCPDVYLEAVIPFGGQPDRWPETDRIRYYRLLGACDGRVTLEDRYSEGCMMRRNRWMVDRADCIISVCDGRRSGTAAAVRMAREKGIPVFPVWKQAGTEYSA